ncbi:MAG TPA: redoxin family protein [Blastocatellia bacterium]|nr:redoxin family protein [Blastocatellia bacterium]
MNPFCKLVGRVGAGLLLAATISLAQTNANSCAPAGEVKEGLRQVAKLGEQDQPYKQRREQQIAMVQTLLKKFPQDFHLQMRYQNDRRYDRVTDKDALLAEYRALKEKHPNDPGAQYLYARLLVGRNTKDAIAELDKLVARAPDFPWSYLELAEIYNYPNFRDAAKSTANLKQWRTKCPDSMNGFYLLSRGTDKELMAATAQALRARLEAAKDQEEIGNWDNLWTLMFKLKPVPEHSQVRQQVAEDVKRLRAQNLNTKEWLQALQAGYRMADDKDGRRWAEDEMLRLFPKSDAAKQMTQTRWREAHPYPKPNDQPEKKLAYHQANLQATAEWIKQWPDDQFIWSSRFFSLSEVEGSTNAALEAAFDGFAKAREKNEGYAYSIPPQEVGIARTFLQRGIRLEQIPAILQKGVAEIERIEANRAPDDLYPREEGDEGGNLRYTRWQAWPLLAEAYAKLKQPDKAQEVLSQMVAALKAEKPGDKSKAWMKSNYAANQVTYWQATAKVAEAVQRKLDALMAYQTALAFRPKSAAPKSGKKDELNDDAQRLWKELGGTEQGWQAYLARNEAARNATEIAEAATWDAKNTALPDFDLTDLQGRKWKLADLKGKVAFINLWATWCGPCLQELPYVQKLNEQMKDKKDVLVLTLNIDEELGMVEPFMKENKYTFPVLPAQAYAEGMGVFSIPRNWVVSVDGKLTFEGIGFGGDGEEWMKKAADMIQKVKDGK